MPASSNKVSTSPQAWLGGPLSCREVEGCWASSFNTSRHGSDVAGSSEHGCAAQEKGWLGARPQTSSPCCDRKVPAHRHACDGSTFGKSVWKAATPAQSAQSSPWFAKLPPRSLCLPAPPIVAAKQNGWIPLARPRSLCLAKCLRHQPIRRKSFAASSITL